MPPPHLNILPRSVKLDTSTSADRSPPVVCPSLSVVGPVSQLDVPQILQESPSAPSSTHPKNLESNLSCYSLRNGTPKPEKKPAAVFNPCLLAELLCWARCRSEREKANWLSWNNRRSIWTLGPLTVEEFHMINNGFIWGFPWKQLMLTKLGSIVLFWHGMQSGINSRVRRPWVHFYSNVSLCSFQRRRRGVYFSHTVNANLVTFICFWHYATCSLSYILSLVFCPSPMPSRFPRPKRWIPSHPTFSGAT